MATVLCTAPIRDYEVYATVHTHSVGARNVWAVFFFLFRRFCHSTVMTGRHRGWRREWRRDWHRDWRRSGQRCAMLHFALKSPGTSEESQCCSLHWGTSTQNHDCCESEWRQLSGTNLHARSAALAPYWPVLKDRKKEERIKTRVCSFIHIVVELCTCRGFNSNITHVGVQTSDSTNMSSCA